MITKNAFIKAELQIRYIVLCILFLPAISCIISKGNVGLYEYIKYIVYQISVIIIPGNMLKNVLKIGGGIEKYESVLFSYILGLCYALFSYIVIIALAHSDFVLMVVRVIVFLIAVVFLTKKDNATVKLPSKKDYIGIFALTILIFLVKTISFSLCQGNFSVDDGVGQTADFYTWASFSTSCKNGIPPINLVSLEPLRYHFFSSVYIADVSKVLNASIINTTLYFSNIEPTIILTLSLFALCKRIFKSKLAIIWAIGAFFFSSGLLVLYKVKLYAMPMGADLALGVFFAILLILAIILENRQFHNGYIMAIAFLVSILTGLKGPYGAVSLLGIFVLCLYKWLKHKDVRRKAIILFVSSLLTFVMTYCSCMYGTTTNFIESSNNSNDANINTNINTNMTEYDYCTTIIQDFSEIGIDFPCRMYKNNPTIVRILFFCVFIILLNPFGSIICIIYCIKYYKEFKVDVMNIIMIAIIIVGSGVSYAVRLYGFSQAYFCIPAISLMSILSGRLVDKLHNGQFLLKYACILVLSMNIVVSWFIEREHISINSLSNGIRVLLNQERTYCYDSIPLTSDEYNAFVWVKNSTKCDQWILSDLDKHINKFRAYEHVPAAVCERKVLFYNDSISFIRERNIDYIVFHKDNESCLSIIQEYELEKKYENNTMIVYENKR